MSGACWPARLCKKRTAAVEPRPARLGLAVHHALGIYFDHGRWRLQNQFAERAGSKLNVAVIDADHSDASRDFLDAVSQGDAFKLSFLSAAPTTTKFGHAIATR